jgi:hypothetical protein
MRRILAVFTVSLVFGLLAARSAVFAENEIPAHAEPEYVVKVHEFEGCECNPVCPCVFSSDTTFGDCRGITVFIFKGKYGSTVLRNVSCVLVFTWAGKNMEATMGNWKGVLYTSDTGTAAELEAIHGLLRAMMGQAFAALEERTAPIKIKREKDLHDLTVGKVAHLRIRALRGQNGKISKILNAPSPLAYPVMACAVAEVHTYDDGKSSWDFAGRNGFYADFDLSNQRP